MHVKKDQPTLQVSVGAWMIGRSIDSIFSCPSAILVLDSSDFEAVSHSPDGFDILRIGGIVFNLFTNLLDMHGDSRNISDRFHIPDLTKQLFFRKNMIGILCQEGKQIEFFRGKRLLHPVDKDTARCFIDFQFPDFDDVILFGIVSLA